MKKESVVSAYNRYSSIYDLIFGPFFYRGRRDLVDSLVLNPGDRVLEVGVGTGASLKLYPSNVSVTGVDISEKMLDVCRKKIERYKIDSATVLNMNAEELEFPDNYFTHVVVMYVVSVSPDTKKLMGELSRVCKPSGKIVVLNHFSRDGSLLSVLERLINPLANLIGFKAFYPVSQFLDDSKLEVTDMFSTNLFGYWSILSGNKPKEKIGPVEPVSATNKESLLAEL